MSRIYDTRSICRLFFILASELKTALKQAGIRILGFQLVVFPDKLGFPSPAPAVSLLKLYSFFQYGFLTFSLKNSFFLLFD
jgi:hypothetical protein